MAYGDPVVVVASAARTVNGNGGPIEPSSDGETIALQVGVTAISGAGATLALAIEWSNDGANFATPDPTADTMTSITAVIQKVKTFERKALFYRPVWTITGTTPSITFSITEYVTG